MALNLKLELETGIQQTPLPPPESIHLSSLRGEKTVNGGVQDILSSIYSRLGFDSILSGTRKDTLWKQALKYGLFMRLLEPSSKLRAVQLIQDRFQKTFSRNQIITKTEASVRLLVLSDELIAILKQMKEENGESKLLFTDKEGEALKYNAIQSLFNAGFMALNLPWPPLIY